MCGEQDLEIVDGGPAASSPLPCFTSGLDNTPTCSSNLGLAPRLIGHGTKCLLITLSLSQVTACQHTNSVSTCQYVLSSQASVAWRTLLKEKQKGDIIEIGVRKVVEGISKEVRLIQPSDMFSEFQGQRGPSKCPFHHLIKQPHSTHAEVLFRHS